MANRGCLQTAWLAASLLVTGCSNSSPPAGGPPAIEIVPRSAWADREPVADRLHPHQPSRLTLHHAGVKDDGLTPGDRKMRGLLAFSLDQKTWGDVPYHFIIDRQGRVFEGRALAYAPDTNTDYDVNGHVGICVNGDLTEQELAEPQYRSLVALLAQLMRRLAIADDRIAGHMDYAQTACPGTLEHYVRDGLLRADLRAWSEGRPFRFVEVPYERARLRGAASPP